MRTDIRIGPSVSGQSPAVGCCEQCNELSGSIKDETFVDDVSNWYVLKRDSSAE